MSIDANSGIGMQVHDAAESFAGAWFVEVILGLVDHARADIGTETDHARQYLDRARELLLSLRRPQGASLPLGGQIRLAEWKCNRVSGHIERNLDQAIPTEELASLVRMSVSHFTRAFKSSFGSTPHRYLVQRRIERAKALMVGTRDPLCQIAVSCGLCDQSHLSRIFARREGTTPNAWRRQALRQVSLPAYS